MSSRPCTIRLDLGPRSYPIIIGRGAVDGVGRRLFSLGFRGRAVVVTQKAPGKLFGPRLFASLSGSGFEPIKVSIPEGEGSKSLERAGKLYQVFIEKRLDRWSPVIALGGGVVGDLAGFVAGSYMRGVPFFQVPTTLVSQVDSSIGGKVAINHPLAKNIIGLFYQPRAVFIDPEMLETLPKRDIVAGCAEIIRYACIADAGFFRYLEENIGKLLDGDEEVRLRAIRRSCAVKARIVEADEREEGDTRSLLNYGHTIGHAVEAAAGYGKYRHGEAVAIGMAAAARLAFNLGVCSQKTMERQIKILKDAGLPVTLRDISSEKALNSLKLDKKIKHGKIRFVLTEVIGRAKVYHGIDIADVMSAMSGPEACRMGPSAKMSHKRGKP